MHDDPSNRGGKGGRASDEAAIRPYPPHMAEEFKDWRSQIVTSNPATKMGVRVA
jgi:hypothetical protein